MTFHVSLTDGVHADIRTILSWIDQRSHAGALAWHRSWQETLRSIREHADQFGTAPESDDHAESIQQAIFKTRRGRPYRALFVIRDRDVYVLHIRGPGQNLLGPDEVRTPG